MAQKLILTPLGAEGMKGAIKKAGELVEKHGYFMPQQFEEHGRTLKSTSERQAPRR